MNQFVGLEKSNIFSKYLTPRYFLVTGSMGLLITFLLFDYRYPAAGDMVGKAFASLPEFGVWVFLQAILLCTLTITLVPLWAALFKLFQSQTQGQPANSRRMMRMNVILNALFLALLVFALLLFLTAARTQVFNPSLYTPRGHGSRITIIYMFTFITALPALLGMMLLHTASHKMSTRINLTDQAQAGLFSLIEELRSFRSLLQAYLLILGIILSMSSITTAGLRALFVALKVATDQNFPISYAIMFGLIFSIILLLIYFPTHMALTETGIKLRDRLCPLDSLDVLKQAVDKRKELDQLLQINISVLDNLKTGFVTLLPFATSILANILNIKIGP